MSAIAFLAGMGTGYLKGEDKKRDQKRQDEKDKREHDLFDAQMADHKQRQTDREDLKAANAPLAVTPDQGAPTAAAMAAQDPLAPSQPAIGYTAGTGANARSFATQGVAQADADSRSTPAHFAQRTAQLAAQGNALAATAQTQGISNRLHTAQASEAEQKLADNAVRKSIGALKTFPDIGKYITDSPADNQGGAFKGDFVLSADGTQEFHQTMPDGTKKPSGLKFSNDAAGLEKARMTLAGAMTPEQRITQNQHDVTNARLEKELERKAKHDDGTLKISQQNADTSAFSAKSQDQARKDAAAHHRAMQGIAAGKGKGEPEPAAFDPRAGFDGKKAQAVAFEQVSKEAEARAAQGSGMTPMTIQEQGKRAQEIYRAHEDAFAGENIKRERARVFKANAVGIETPEQLEEVRARSAKSGYTPAEMAGIDPRFAIKAPVIDKKPAATASTPPAAKKEAYVPIANSPAAHAIAARTNLQEQQKAAAVRDAIAKEQKRRVDEEEAIRQAAIFRQRNGVK